MCNVLVVFTDGTEENFKINELKEEYMKYVDGYFIFKTSDEKAITVVARNVNFIEIDKN